MAEKVIIYLGHKGDDVQWVVSKPSEQIISQEGHGSLDDAAEVAHGRRVVVLIPSDEVLLSHVTVPTRNISKVRVAVPNILEEMLSDDVDDMHFALGSHHAEHVYPVVAISRSRIEYYQHLLSEANIKVEKLMPSVLALPYSEGNWSALQEGDEIVVRESEYIGFSCAPDNLDLFLKQALKESDFDENPVVHVFQDEVNIPDNLEIEVDRQRTGSLMHVFAQGVDQGLVINLLQGEYKPLRKENPVWKKWRMTAALAAAVSAIWLGTTFWDVYQMKNQNAALIAEIESTYLSTFPGSRLVNPRAQMQQKLNKIKKGPTQESGFLSKLGNMSDVLKGNQLLGIDYKKNMFEVDVQVKDLRSLEELKDRIAALGLKAEIGTAKSEKGVVNGSLKVQ